MQRIVPAESRLVTLWTRIHALPEQQAGSFFFLIQLSEESVKILKLTRVKKQIVWFGKV